MWDLRPNLVSKEGKNGEGQEKREKKRKRERRRKEEKKKGRSKRYGFYDFWFGYYMESEDLMVLNGILGNFMSSKPRVLLGIDPNSRFE